MKLDTYEQIAKKVGVPLADVDWTDRNVTRSGIRRYLMIAATRVVPETKDMPPWARLWSHIVWTRTTAKDVLHVKFPPELWEEDKARLMALLTKDGGSYDWTKLSALRWARRRR